MTRTRPGAHRADPPGRSARAAQLRALSERRGLRDFSQLAGRGVLLQVILLASGPVVARLLGPEGRGELALAMTIGLMGAQGVIGGIGVAVARAVAAAGAPARAVLRPHLTRWVGYGAVAAGFAAGATYVLLSRADSIHAVGLTIAAAGIAAFATANQLLGAMLRGEGDIRGVTVIPIATTLTYVVAVVLCWLLVPATPAVAVAVIYIGSQLLSLLLAWHRLPPPDDSASEDRRSLARTARRSWATAVNTLGLGFDQVVVAALLSTHALGLYVVAVSITNVPAMALRSVASMLMPRLVAAPPTVRRGMARRWLAAAAGLDLAIVLVLEVVIGPVIRWLFGAEFTGATTAARIMILAWGFLAFRLVLTSILQAQDRAGRASVVEIAATVFMVIATAIGADRAGIEGVAVAVALVAALACAAAMTQIRWDPPAADQRASS